MSKKFWQLTSDDREQEYYKQKMDYCYVAFIDILGFKEMSEKNFDKVILALRKFKSFAIEYYNNVNGKMFEIDAADHKINEDLMPKVTMFSDSIVISAKERYNLLSDFICGLESLQFDLLSNGILIRGGVDVGYIYQDEFLVFGDGLISAYTLESTTAIYPRIVIGKNAKAKSFQRYDDEFNQEIENSVMYHYTEAEKEQIYSNYYSFNALGNIIKEDRVDYIDYLYAAFDAHFPTSENVFANIRKVILDGLMHDVKSVQDKYDWLKDYYNFAIDRSSKEIITDKNIDRVNRLCERLKL